MQVIVNGKREALGADTTVAQFLAAHDLRPETVVVELNETIIASDRYADTRLAENDRLEIVRFVGGG